MEKTQAEKAPEAKATEKLSLVLEVIPGQAKEGLLTIFEAGKWETTELSDLVQKALAKDCSIEERDLVGKINEQMDGGKLLYNNKEIHSTAADYAVREKTEAGQDYLYVALRAIKPQEGGRAY